MSLDATLRLFGGMDTLQYAKYMKTLVDFATFDKPNDARAKYSRLATLPPRNYSAAAQVDEPQQADELESALRAEQASVSSPDDSEMAASKAEAAKAAPQPEGARAGPDGKRDRPAASTSASPLVVAPKAPRFGLGTLMSGFSGLMSGAVPPPPAPPKDGSRFVLPIAQSQEQVEEV